MNEKEVFKEITSRHKWYIGFCSSGYATQLKQRFEDGRLSQKTINNMFEFFGYVVVESTKWRKSEGKPNNLKTK